MSIPDDLIQQLEKVIRSLHDIGVPKDNLRWEVEGLVKRVYGVRSGRKPKLDKQIVFNALTTWRNEVYARHGRWPRQFQMALFVAKNFGCSKEQAKKLVRTFELLYIDGIRQLLSVQHLAPLSQSDRLHLEKNFSREWSESKKISRAVAKSSAETRKILDQLAKGTEQQDAKSVATPSSPRRHHRDKR